MNQRKFKVELLGVIDSTKDAWLTSKPTIKYDDEEDLKRTLDEMIKQDLPLSAFKQYHLKLESSLLFRDLLFTLRPCIAWSSSFRINPITPDNIYIEESPLWDHMDFEIMDAGMIDPYEKYNKGVALDIVKLGLYMATMTQYVVSIDSRTLMCFIATLYDLDKVGFEYHIKELCKILGFESYEDLPSTSANSLLDKLRVGDDEDYSRLTPIEDFQISEFITNEDYLGFSGLDVIVDASTGGQFLRQHFSLMRSQWFDIVKSKGYHDSMMYRCKDYIRYISFGQDENFKQLVRRRICWVSHMDHSYKTSGIISWSDILEPIISGMNVHEFAKLLPCRLSYKNCTVSEETRLRLWKNKGVEGVLPDENPPCSILVGDPSMVDKRVKFYGSNSPIIDKWKSLVENNLIKKRETKWSNENER